MKIFLFISAISSVPAETTSGLPVHGATLPDVPGTGEALRVLFCERGAAAERLEHCHSVGRLERSHFVFEVIDASGTKSCFNVGWCGCFILYFSKNLAKSLLGEIAFCAMVLKDQNLFVPGVLKWSKDRYVRRLQFMCSLIWKA